MIIETAQQVREIARGWLKEHRLENAVVLADPEYHPVMLAWRAVLLCRMSKREVGQVHVDPEGNIVTGTTSEEMVIDRILGRNKSDDLPEIQKTKKRKRIPKPKLSELKSHAICDDCTDYMLKLPEESVNLIFTSPPYYSAKMEYADYVDYDDYLNHLRHVIRLGHRVLSEGRFFVINVSPIILKRRSRNEQSKRLNIPFDLHPIFLDEGFDFIDDILWVKSEGAGWASMRGTGFARTRVPLRYKTNPITEYVLVYRKHTDRLIDWNINKHPIPEDVEASKVPDGYEPTNVWKIQPVSHDLHPAVFPPELARRVIQFYSLKNDVVLDPFAGIGTTAHVAREMGRRYVMIERDETYFSRMVSDLLDLDMTTPIS